MMVMVVMVGMRTRMTTVTSDNNGLFSALWAGFAHNSCSTGMIIDHDAHDVYDYYHGRNKGHMLLLIMFPTQSMLFSRPDIDTFVGSLSTVLQFA